MLEVIRKNNSNANAIFGSWQIDGSSFNRGILGSASKAGFNIGVEGQSFFSPGLNVGVYGYGLGSGSQTIGKHGVVSAEGSGEQGVYGWTTGEASGVRYAIYGLVDGTDSGSGNFNRSLLRFRFFLDA